MSRSVGHLARQTFLGILYAHSSRDELYQGTTRGLTRPSNKIGHYLEYARRFEYRELCSSPEALSLLDNKLRTKQVADLARIPTTRLVGVSSLGRLWNVDSGTFAEIRRPTEFLQHVPASSSLLSKPINSRWGQGVQISSRDTLRQNATQAASASPTMIEVREKSAFSRTFPGPVPTLRVMTYSPRSTTAADVEVLGCVLRFGRQDAIVDNMSSGGAVFHVNRQTGMITGGIDANMQPTNISAPARIPPDLIAEAISMSISMHMRVPGLGSAGWDVGLTTRGPLLIEGNGDWGIELLQAVEKRSMRLTMRPARRLP
ncbi:sugar-transfer associated ATP-grasp domain-containing protein [Kribbella koreensis]|uniref:sugar-transfer associated ATP-grasp domain-containing protein n=1 Tax=Kribbella koreensis TaxID=57909 RepID=UPI003CD07298